MPDRCRLAKLSRKEMCSRMASLRIRRALQHRNTSACDHAFGIGDKVLVWRENAAKNHIGNWTGPQVLDSIAFDSKLIQIRLINPGNILPFSLTQAKPYLSPFKASQSFLCDIVSALWKTNPPAE